MPGTLHQAPFRLYAPQSGAGCLLHMFLPQFWVPRLACSGCSVGDWMVE